MWYKSTAKTELEAEAPTSSPTESPISEDKDPDHVPGYTLSDEQVNVLDEKGLVDDQVIIRTGADASRYLLSLRDDGDPVLTLRSAVLGTAFACFQAAMNQIYNVGCLSLQC